MGTGTGLTQVVLFAYVLVSNSPYHKQVKIFGLSTFFVFSIHLYRTSQVQRNFISIFTYLCTALYPHNKGVLPPAGLVRVMCKSAMTSAIAMIATEVKTAVGSKPQRLLSLKVKDVASAVATADDQLNNEVISNEVVLTHIDVNHVHGFWALSKHERFEKWILRKRRRSSISNSSTTTKTTADRLSLSIP
jgi:hypothetical protein